MTNPYEVEDFGAPCGSCGDDAVEAVDIVGVEGDVPLCGSCLDHAVTFCGNCERRIWQAEGYRTFGTPTLYCVTCDEAVRDALKLVQLPDMNAVRR
jgi:hypothetical protein